LPGQTFVFETIETVSFIGIDEILNRPTETAQALHQPVGLLLASMTARQRRAVCATQWAELTGRSACILEWDERRDQASCERRANPCAECDLVITEFTSV
jgi:hypothetical protein